MRKRGIAAVPAAFLLAGLFVVLSARGADEPAAAVVAVDAGSPASDANGGYPVDILWTVMAAVLVFWMQAGFAMLEAGFTRAKNAGNIMMKNLLDFSMGSLAYWAIGFGIMFGVSSGWFGTSWFFVSHERITDFSPGDETNMWPYAFLLFQTVFAATAATIVSGAMAERTKFHAYLLYSIGLTAIIYPVFGGWAWNSLYGTYNGDSAGWLEAVLSPGEGADKLAFIDFAGSTVVHSVGGWAALAGAIMLGPRRGKYGADGKPRAIPGHNITLAALGVFILWMGWFGFNAGSTTAVTGEGGKQMAWIAVNTNLAAAAGVVGALIAIWMTAGKPDVGITLNGALAGLVAITAPCGNVSAGSSVIIGFLAGILVVFAVRFFDKIKIDDPVGAISVHGVCGVWGTLAAALFATGGFSMTQLMVQVIGVVACFVWTFGTAMALFATIKYTVGLRVSEETEIAGLDLHEHGSEAYADFAARIH